MSSFLAAMPTIWPTTLSLERCIICQLVSVRRPLKMFFLKIIALKNSFRKISNRRNIGTKILWLFLKIINIDRIILMTTIFKSPYPPSILNRNPLPHGPFILTTQN